MIAASLVCCSSGSWFTVDTMQVYVYMHIMCVCGVCVGVCVCACMCVCMHVCCACVCVCMFVCAYDCKCVGKLIVH